jgi:hypothetical protein
MTKIVQFPMTKEIILRLKARQWADGIVNAIDNKIQEMEQAKPFCKIGITLEMRHRCNFFIDYNYDCRKCLNYNGMY